MPQTAEIERCPTCKRPLHVEDLHNEEARWAAFIFLAVIAVIAMIVITALK